MTSEMSAHHIRSERMTKTAAMTQTSRMASRPIDPAVVAAVADRTPWTSG